jgi:hypothetical protein
MNDLVKMSKMRTQEADSNFSGKMPSITEVKSIERMLTTEHAQSKNVFINDQNKSSTDAQYAHSKMMESILQSLNDRGEK